MKSAMTVRRITLGGLLSLSSLCVWSAFGATASYLEPVSRVGPRDEAAFNYDAKAPLDVRVVSSVKKNGVTLQSITYASPRGGLVQAGLILPDGPGPFAGILLMHGAPGSHRQMMPEGEDLARRGAVALLIDAPFARPDLPDEMQEPFTVTERDRRHQIQLIVDLRRGVDLLTARRDVDKKRLGYVGISYGGAMGGLLAGVEKRIKAYVLVVGDGGIVSHHTGPAYTGDMLQRLPSEQVRHWRAWMDPIEPLRFVGRAAPAHLLFQNGRQDTTVPPAHAKIYQEAGSQPKKILWYDAGHHLNEQAVHDRHEWLAGELGLRKR
jgi:dienelactone hydrolase